MFIIRIKRGFSHRPRDGQNSFCAGEFGGDNDALALLGEGLPFHDLHHRRVPRERSVQGDDDGIGEGGIVGARHIEIIVPACRFAGAVRGVDGRILVLHHRATAQQPAPQNQQCHPSVSHNDLLYGQYTIVAGKIRAGFTTPWLQERLRRVGLRDFGGSEQSRPETLGAPAPNRPTHASNTPAKTNTAPHILARPARERYPQPLRVSAVRVGARVRRSNPSQGHTPARPRQRLLSKRENCAPEDHPPHCTHATLPQQTPTPPAPGTPTPRELSNQKKSYDPYAVAIAAKISCASVR